MKLATLGGSALATVEPHYLSPAGLAKSGTEDAHQTAFFCWARRAARVGMANANDMTRYAGIDDVLIAANSTGCYAQPELDWIHAIPNGGARDGATAGVMKATGVTSGVHDTFLPVPRHGFHGLYMELKVKKNTPSDAQKKFAEFVIANGYFSAFCYGWEQMRDCVTWYLSP